MEIEDERALLSECCKEDVTERRYCPKCGWECHVVKARALSAQSVELPIKAMVKAALDNHCQLLTDIFMHLPTEVIDDDMPKVAAGFIGAIVRTCVIAARANTSERESNVDEGESVRSADITGEVGVTSPAPSKEVIYYSAVYAAIRKIDGTIPDDVYEDIAKAAIAAMGEVTK